MIECRIYHLWLHIRINCRTKEVLFKNINVQAPAPGILFNWSETVLDDSTLVIRTWSHWSTGPASYLKALNNTKSTNSPPKLWHTNDKERCGPCPLSVLGTGRVKIMNSQVGWKRKVFLRPTSVGAARRKLRLRRAPGGGSIWVSLEGRAVLASRVPSTETSVPPVGARWVVWWLTSGQHSYSLIEIHVKWVKTSNEVSNFGSFIKHPTGIYWNPYYVSWFFSI